MITSAVVVCEQGRDAHADAHLYHGDHHDRAPGGGHGSDGTGAVGIEKTIRESGRQA